jgi:hypothetical protein
MDFINALLSPDWRTQAAACAMVRNEAIALRLRTSEVRAPNEDLTFFNWVTASPEQRPPEWQWARTLQMYATECNIEIFFLSHEHVGARKICVRMFHGPLYDSPVVIKRAIFNRLNSHLSDLLHDNKSTAFSETAADPPNGPGTRSGWGIA